MTNCGLDEQALNVIAARVKLIINCAGKVEFFPPVDESLHANVDGVENAIALAKRAGARLLHVSTCFVSGEADGLIEETEPIIGFYPHRKGSDDNAFDALVAALVARAAAIGETIKIPKKHLEVARREGWIALPTEGSLDRLVP